MKQADRLSSAASAKHSAIAAIRQVVDRYLESARKGQSAIFRNDVFADARIRGSLNGAFVDISADQYLAFIDEKGAATTLAAEIETIDVAGGAAGVRIAAWNWHGMNYSDFLVLADVGGTWKVAGKVFDGREAD